MNRENLASWIDRTLYVVNDDKGPCCKLVLRHVGGNTSKDGDLWDAKISHDDQIVTLPEEEIIEMVHDIEHAANADADGLGGVQKYKLLAYFSRESVPRRFTFRMKGSGDDLEDEDEMGLTEPASKRGHLGQMMRHNEAIMRISVMGQSQVSSLMQRTIANQQNQIESLLKDRRDTLEMTENLKSKQHERELATLEAEHNASMKERAFEKGSMLIPAVVNRIAGRKILAESATPAEQLMLSLAESLTQKQLENLLSTMGPEQRITFLELMEATQPDEESGKPKSLPGGKQH